MTAAGFALILLGVLIALFGVVTPGGDVPFIAVGLLAIFGAGVLQILGRRQP